MEDLEKRLIRLEDGMARMESAVERMADAIEALIEVRIHNDTHSKEIVKLREASHIHGNMLQELPHLREKICRHEKRQDNIEERVEVLEQHDPLHNQSDSIVNKAMWAAAGVVAVVVLHRVGLL